MNTFRNFVELIGITVDGAGVLVIVVGLVIATAGFLRGRADAAGSPYRLYRQNLGRAILLGLELLVAGDIIRTVVVDPTLDNVIVLGLVVLIRTFLSTALQLELDGRWPWQRAVKDPDQPATK